MSNINPGANFDMGNGEAPVDGEDQDGSVIVNDGASGGLNITLPSNILDDSAGLETADTSGIDNVPDDDDIHDDVLGNNILDDSSDGSNAGLGDEAEKVLSDIE